MGNSSSGNVKSAPASKKENASSASQQKQQVQITTLLNLATYLDEETLMQNICDILDIDYEEIKDKLPKPEEDDLYDLKTIPAVPNKEGGVIE